MSTERRPSCRRTTQRVRTQSVLQMEAVECGAASLAMVLRYFGRYVPLEELRTACGVSRDGSKATNIMKAAREYGMIARGVRKEPEGLAAGKLPLILFWEFNHFVVLEGFGRRFGQEVVYLNDPAQGHRTVSASEFDASFTGVALDLRPGPDFQVGGKPPGQLSGLRRRYFGSDLLLVLAVLTSLLLTVTGVALPAYTRAFVDTILVGGDTSIRIPFVLLMTATIVATALLTGLRESFLHRVRIISATIGSSRFLRHLFRLPARFFTQRSPADITNRMQTNDTLAVTLANDLSGAVISAMVVVLYAALMWTYSVVLTLLCIVVALGNIVALRLATRARSNGVTRLAADRATFLTTSYSGLQLIESMKASGAENEHFRRWASEHAVVMTGQQKVGVPPALLAVVPPALASVNATLILLVGGLQALSGHITVGLLVAFQALVVAFTAPMGQFTAVAGRMQDFVVQLTRLRDVENFPVDEATDDPLDGRPLRRLTGQLVFDEVTFGYSPLTSPLIQKLSFSVGPGEQIALVGGSGSGKSTVTRLLSGLYQPWEGAITIDGIFRNSIPRAQFSASVAFVDQDIFLFEGTIRDNLTLWDQSVPDDDIINALKSAHIYDVISSRPGGIYSQVEQDGRNFSGGQRQRLEIARALVRNPSLLVLDEATSALDAETESLITDNLRRRGCATIVVAHRLSTIRDSDQIIVLERGLMVEQGDHEKLVSAAGRYAQLIGEH
ncbi:NHLP family bacteriocin export ABC transporter peptidase/permease/ATPase subunit [Streptomyces cadmiisoli]|uniref:NHLP family bacteriocin export ABC transporter peptidase/permease/ATPase subunit n=1 Tax=Streptomyces cadmiisoli TaxID=2184053 RepID=A0A2Z4JEG4_9ACTN|nr:NHLP family bacteriocin export ABC transporter peptidase/permease/ATPase subunit [Streptomyces cadmiisoli]AWW43504.1 NHLP family bacteriocin export ABC transporter peptidase/permease/ATPase subunit [Streptomyces cadmiisoli]